MSAALSLFDALMLLLVVVAVFTVAAALQEWISGPALNREPFRPFDQERDFETAA